jgi:hypothetical protein
MSTVDGTVRISVEVPIELNDRLKILLPWGTKSEIVRVLLDMLLDAQMETGDYIMQDILKGRAKITVQNLNK